LEYRRGPWHWRLKGAIHQGGGSDRRSFSTKTREDMSKTSKSISREKASCKKGLVELGGRRQVKLHGGGHSILEHEWGNIDLDRMLTVRGGRGAIHS